MSSEYFGRDGRGMEAGSFLWVQVDALESDFFCYWSIWMKRNDGIFMGSSSLIEDVLERAAFCVANWMSVKSSPNLRASFTIGKHVWIVGLER